MTYFEDSLTYEARMTEQDKMIKKERDDEYNKPKINSQQVVPLSFPADINNKIINYPQYNPKETSINNFKRAYEEGLKKGKEEGILKLEELKRRICFPNKPVNTFTNAVEIKYIIEEIQGELK